jgi:kinesin family protein 4/21/27
VLQVLDGELAQRAEATRKLREVQKQLMLLGGLVPPSPVVTAAAAAAAAASRGAGAAAAAAAAAKAALPREEVLQQEAARLQAAIDKHSANVKVSITCANDGLMYHAFESLLVKMTSA